MNKTIHIYLQNKIGIYRFNRQRETSLNIFNFVWFVSASPATFFKSAFLSALTWKGNYSYLQSYGPFSYNIHGI